MNMERIDLKRMQTIELEMLIEFINICTRYNLRYFLICGTCLGAVRHSGFIPWDDDIDIGMPRNDYNRFLEVAKSELPNHLFIQNYDTEKDFLFNFTKIRNCKTTFVEKSVSKMDINHGVYIDIFPLDGVPENIYMRKIKNVMQTFFKLGLHGHYLDDTHNMKLLTKTVGYVMKKLFNPYKLHKMLDQTVIKYDYDTHGLVNNYFGAWEEKEVVPRACFGNGCPWEFEKINVIIPEQYEQYLTYVYGDYMTQPPKEKQVTHHETSIIDLNTPYIYYAKKQTVEK